jgi:hypothetical protein
MKIIVASPHKVGSTWLAQMLRDIVGVKRLFQLPENYRHNPKLPEILNLNAPRVRDYLAGLQGSAVFKSHSNCPSWVPEQNLSDDVYFFTILRDPRDALISLAFYLTTIPSDRGGHPELDALTTTDRLHWILESGRGDLPLYEGWASAEGVHKFLYENLLADPKAALVEGFEKYRLPLEVTEKILAAHSFESKSGGRTRGTEDPKAFLRKGTAGDWKNHFDKALVDKFKSAQKGRWNKILLQLGYEKSADWQMSASPET